MATDTHQLELFIRLPEVRQRVGLSKSQIYKLISEDQFPHPVKVSQRISCWVEVAPLFQTAIPYL